MASDPDSSAWGSRAALHDREFAQRLLDGWHPCDGDATIDLVMALQRAAFRSRAFADRLGVKLRVSSPAASLSVCCDSEAAQQTLTNLLLHAITHAMPGDRVQTVVDVNAERFTVRLRTSDRDAHVRSLRPPRVTDSRADGTSLGLAVATEICNRCGWFLTIQGRSQGLEITVEGSAQSRSTREPQPVNTGEDDRASTLRQRVTLRGSSPANTHFT